MKIVATIEARMTSSRLPGKVLMPVLGKPMLHYLITRLRTVPSLDAIILATTTNITDEPVVAFAKSMGIEVFRGSEDDVMGRVVGAAQSVNADVVVEITGDCPIIDPDLVEQTIRMYLSQDVDYSSNSIIRSYPDGMDTQVFALDILKAAAEITTEPLDREHVCRYIWRHPQKYKLLHLVAPPSLHWPELGLTLDEPEDFKLITKIIKHFDPSNPLFGCGDVINYLKKNNDLLMINDMVARKGDA